MAGEMLLEQTVKEVKPSVEEKQQSVSLYAMHFQLLRGCLICSQKTFSLHSSNPSLDN